MTKVIIVGDIYNADLGIGGGPIYPPVGGGTPPGIWGPPGPWPTPPIHIPGQPPQGGYPSHPIYYPPYPDQGLPPFPSHPIAPGGGGQPPYPDQGLPPFPSHPIAPGGGGTPPGTWGPNDPRPTNPIYIPTQTPPIDPADPSKAYVVAYVPNTSTGKIERITFTVQLPESETPPTEATPKT